MKKLLALLCFLCICAVTIAQQSAKGTVNDAKGQPIPGATITNVQTGKSVVSDPNGEFEISATAGNTIRIESIGYSKQEFKYQPGKSLSANLESKATDMDQVVVIGYGTASKKDLTGSSASIKAKDIADKPVTNPMSAIQGKVAGVQIVNTGRIGSDPDIRIRGTNSINNVKPLYVVDGIFNDNIDFLNPADIESMDILKDASSLAIFGVRGANGVITITTKKAKSGQTNVNFNTSVGFKTVQNRDRIKLTNADQFKTLFEEQRKNEAEDLFRPYTPYDYTYWQANTDWQDEIFQNGVINYNNLSISSSTDKNKFYFGAGYTTEGGVIKHERYQKITFTLNDEYKISKAIKFGVNFNGFRANMPQDRNVGSALTAAPIAAPYNEDYGLYSRLPDFQAAQVSNPLVAIEVEKNTQVKYQYRAVGNIFGEVNFLRNFNFRAALYADYGFNTNRQYFPVVVLYNPMATDMIDSSRKITSVNQSQNIFIKTQQDYLLTYKNKWGDHNLTAVGGMTSNYNYYEGTSASRSAPINMPIPNNKRFWYAGIGDAATQTGSGDAWDYATLSYLARAIYSYQGKYLLNASFRRDGTSAFHKSGNEWQTFGAVGAAWVVSQEKFMEKYNWLNYLKIKGSWGVLGNQGVGDNKYPAYPVLNNGSVVFGDNTITTLTPAYIADPNLHWETAHSWETGFELNTLRNRLHFEGVYYHKKTQDILVVVPAIATAGIPSGMGNLGTLINKGVELSATWNDKINNDWSYSVSGNLTTIDNKVTRLVKKGFTVTSNMSYTQEGYPVGYFYGYVADGIYQTYTDIIKSEPTEFTVNPGDIKFKDIDGDGKITTADRTMIGNPTPDFTYGMSFSINYKGFDLGVDMMGVYGNEIFRERGRKPAAPYNYAIERMDRWTGPGTSNWEPILSNTRAVNQEWSSYYIEDGSYFRIRNIQLGYNFNTDLLRKIYIKSLRVYANAQNPLTFKHNSGYSPEFGGSAISFGVDNGSYPMPASYTLGLNLNF